MTLGDLGEAIFQKFYTVPERVRRVEAARSGNRFIPDHAVSRLGETLAEPVDLIDKEGWVGFLLRSKVHIDTHMDLASPSSKPAPTATLQEGWLRLLHHLKDLNEERPRLDLFPSRHRELHVVDDQRGLNPFGTGCLQEST